MTVHLILSVRHVQSAWLNHPERWLYYVGAVALNDRALGSKWPVYTNAADIENRLIYK